MEETTTTTAPGNPPSEGSGDNSNPSLFNAAPPAATPSGDADAAFLNPKGEFEAGWIDRLPEGFKDDAAMLASFKDLPALLKSYIHSQRMLGGKANAVQIPGENATPEEKAEFFEKIGVPKDVKEYPSKPTGLPEGAEWDTEATLKFNQIAHANGVPPKAMAQILDAYNEYAGVQAEKAQLAEKAQVDANRKALADEWGAKYDANLALAKRAARSVGADLNSPGFADPAVVKAFQRLATQISDDRLITADSPATQMIGHARGMDIIRNPTNPLHSRYRAGDEEVGKLVTDLLKQQ
jgi:hypothetical protein